MPDCGGDDDSVYVGALKCSNVMTSTETDILPP